MPATNENREIVNTLLVKLGIENPEKLTNERAESKVEAKIKGKGMPEELTAEEYQYVKSLGLTGGAIPPAKPAEINDETQCPPEAIDAPVAKPAKSKAGKKVIHPAKAVETASTTEEKAPHILKGVDGGEDRTESITPTMAKSRNSRRADNRKWEPQSADAVVDSTPAEPTPKKAEKPKETAVADVKIPHRLKGIEGKPDRVELISPAKAELRNGQRSDDRRWTPDTEIDPATVGTEGLWIDQPKAAKPEKATKVKVEKPAKAAKPEKVAKVKAEKPVKENKVKKPKQPRTKGESRIIWHGLSQSDFIRSLNKKYTNAEVLFLAQKAGFDPRPHTVYKRRTGVAKGKETATKLNAEQLEAFNKLPTPTG